MKNQVRAQVGDLLKILAFGIEDDSEDDRATSEEIATARFLYQDDDIQIDDGAAASRGRDENGNPVVWVAAWVLLPGPEENNWDSLVNT